MTGKRNQRELLWFQTGGALNFITAAPHCGAYDTSQVSNTVFILKTKSKNKMIILTKSLTHFLPSKLRTTYSCAQVKFEKNEWCQQKTNHKQIIHTPI
jgi:hypothetical protein